ncbi:hypothetical protein DMUE_3961 [Dictyocoela muelleri]|nr:hypothetical protein DMUE_3961 [Dictyocoela muelleri]
MKYTRKKLTLVPINRNSNFNKDLRYLYGVSLNNIQDNQLIFLDESGFNLHTFQQLGYSPKNTKCYVNSSNSKSTNISLLRAITFQGNFSYKIKIGSFKSADLNDFICEDLPLLSPHDRKYIIIDNKAIHKTREVGNSFLQKNYILNFLPPILLILILLKNFFLV